MHLDWFDLAILKTLAAGAVIVLVASWRGWGRLLRRTGRGDREPSE